jgi:hypothetical protein
MVRDVQVREPLTWASGTSLLLVPRQLSQQAKAMNHGFSPSPSAPDPLAGMSVSVAVDSVEFADGTTAGPDTLQLSGRLAARRPAMTAFYTELSARLQSASSDSDIQGWLKTFAVPVSRSPEDIDFAASAVAMRALKAQDIYEKQGRAGVTAWVNTRMEVK